MGVDGRLALVGTFPHVLADHPHHPDDAQQVVDVLVGDKDGAHLPPVQPGVLELMQHGHSAAAIHHKMVIAIAQNKTGIVALRYQCIACAQHGQFHRLLLLKNVLVPGQNRRALAFSIA